MCIAIMGLFSACPLLISWGTNNTAPAGRRAMISSMLTAVANFGGIAGSFMFLDREAPVYGTSVSISKNSQLSQIACKPSRLPKLLTKSWTDTGYGLSVACGATGMIGSAVLYLSWRHLNKRRAVVNEGEMRDKYTDMELLRLGDRSPLFKYQL